ncbi:MAG TPA: hypothetical protein V6C95_06755 [Coleofasciculaceae cyanobacterium]
MAVSPRVVRKFSKILLWVLIVVEVGLAIIYLAGILLTGKAYPGFDMDGQMTIPSFLQSFHLFLIGAISLSLLITSRNSSHHPSRLFLLTVAVLFIYGSIDEIFKIHLQLYNLLSTTHKRAWMPIYLGIGITTPLVFHRDFIALWHFCRKAIVFVALGMGIFILGGFFSELFKYELVQAILSYFFQQENLIPLFVEKFRVAVEEFSELLGESLTLYGLCLYLAQRLEKTSKSAIANI